jgi:hypothetical protein
MLIKFKVKLVYLGKQELKYWEEKFIKLKQSKGSKILILGKERFSSSQTIKNPYMPKQVKQIKLDGKCS